MFKSEKESQDYLFALANLIAAFGGGMILGKGINVLNLNFLNQGSILAYFFGTILGLFFLTRISDKWSKLLSGWLSILGSGVSFLLLYLFMHYSVNSKMEGGSAVIFFLLLSLRFGFWFYSRVLRAAAAAGKEQRIAGVELGYYIGIILGLIVWQLLRIDIIMPLALLLDAILQCLAGIMDLIVKRMVPENKKSTLNSQSSLSTSKTDSNQIKSCWRLAWSVVFLSIGVQVVTFNFAHSVAEWFSPYIIATFYFGVALAAFCYKKYKIRFEWNSTFNQDNNAVICIGDNKLTMSFQFNIILNSLAVFLTIVGSYYWNWGMIHNSFSVDLDLGEIILLILIVISAFIYEILALALLDRIGIEEQSLKQQNMIIKTYGLMGLMGAISLWILGISNISILGLLFPMFLCLICSVLLVFKRKLV